MRVRDEQRSGSSSNAALGQFRIIAMIVLATLILAWPAVLNRGPFFIADTTGYLRSADAAFSSIFSYNSIWSDKRDLYKLETSVEPNPTGHANAAPETPAHPPLIGRSIYYGALIYAPVLMFGEQAGVMVQAVLAAIIVWLALVPIGLACRRFELSIYFGAIGVLAITTSLPFTVTLLVPDYLTGLACAAMALLFCFWRDYSRLEKWILAGIIALAALSHSSNLPLLVILSLAGVAAKLLKVELSGKAAIIGLGAVSLGFAGDALFVYAVSYKTGMTPIRPPFLTARLIADGPGHKLLREHCSVQSFEVCRYTARTPHDSDLFLWSEGADGVFSVADFSSQERMSEQDLRFAIATFRDYPLLTLASSGEAFARQLGLIDLRIWRGGGNAIPLYELSNLPTPVAARMAQTLSYQGQMPVEPFESIIALVATALLIVAVWCLVHAWRSSNARTRMLGIALSIAILSIVANAAITGGLSKPDARYNLRVIWLLPLFTYLYAARIILRPEPLDQEY